MLIYLKNFYKNIHINFKDDFKVMMEEIKKKQHNLID